MSVRLGWLVLFAVVVCSTTQGQTTRRQPTAANTSSEVGRHIEALSSRETQKRIQAAEKLGEMGPRAAPAIPSLIGMLRYWGLESIQIGDQQIASFNLSAEAAASALGQIGKPAISPLRTVLIGPRDDSDRPLWAARALARMNDPAAIQLLLSVAKQPASPARADIAAALGDSEHPQALEALLLLIKDQDPKVRKGAAQGLGEKKAVRSVDALVLALRDTDPEVRGAAASGLLHASDPRTFSALVSALKDTNSLVRNLSAQALGSLKDSRAIEPLVELVASDADNLVKFQAGRALEGITGQKFGEDGAKWKKWWEQQKGK